LVGLNRLIEARDAVRAGLSIKPDDKELLAQLNSVELLLVNGAQNAGTVKPTSSAGPVATSHTVTSSSSKPAVPAKTESASAGVPSSNTDEDDSSETFRGYKKRADGRVTTFFNNDLDETVSFNIFCGLCLTEHQSGKKSHWRYRSQKARSGSSAYSGALRRIFLEFCGYF
jgi:hypothetical protein